ncbi:hypothetical protein BJ138DRAFT_77005, partial [Hygrophoropsis aurantiaca]
SFRPLFSASWAVLAEEIQLWLTDGAIDSHSEDWLWGREFFWMAYIAAYPEFPRGSWPLWSSKIAMEGDFLSHWMELSGGSLPQEGSVISIRETIWDEFRQLAAFLSHRPVLADP